MSLTTKGSVVARSRAYCVVSPPTVLVVLVPSPSWANWVVKVHSDSPDGWSLPGPGRSIAPLRSLDPFLSLDHRGPHGVFTIQLEQPSAVRAVSVHSPQSIVDERGTEVDS